MSVSCVSRLPPVSLNLYVPAPPGVFLPVRAAAATVVARAVPVASPRASLEPATVCGPRPDGRGLVGWMVVRFVCVIRVPVCPVCVPAPPGVFLPVR